MKKTLFFPVNQSEIENLNIGDCVLISGTIFCGRDAVLPKIAEMIKTGMINDAPFDLKGGLIFHTAVSKAGIGPTSSNKLEIESTMGILSSAGIAMHLGKGKLSNETVRILQENNAVYAIIPPVTAILNKGMKSKKIAAFEELGMEALYELEVENYPAIIAIANGESIYD